MQENYWNIKKLLMLGGMLLLLAGIVTLTLVEGVADFPVHLFAVISIAVIVIAIGALYVTLLVKGKIKQTDPDYRLIFFMGLVFLPLGISNPPFLVFSLVFIAIGLVNKDKWKPEPKWSELPQSKKNLKIGVMVALGLLLVVGYVMWYQGSQNKNQAEVIGDKVETEIGCDGPEDVCPKQIECSDGLVTEDIEVCGKINVVCITAPCDPVEETFKNRCEAREREAFDIKMGSCEYWNESDTFIQTQGPVTYSIAYLKTWFQHDAGQNVIFTKDAVLAETPGTEGYALGPQFTIATHDFSDSDLRSYEEWLDLYGMTETSEFFVSSSNENVNGYQMRRVLTQAAGAGGQVLHYVFLVNAQIILVFSQYPYDAETTDTQDFEQVMQTFRIEDREMEVISSAELIEKECRTLVDCPVPLDYAVQSNCPYSGACVEGRCAVICPMWEQSPNPERSVSYQVECSVSAECDCSGWDMSSKYDCGCFDGRCGSLVLSR